MPKPDSPIAADRPIYERPTGETRSQALLAGWRPPGPSDHRGDHGLRRG